MLLKMFQGISCPLKKMDFDQILLVLLSINVEYFRHCWGNVESVSIF